MLSNTNNITEELHAIKYLKNYVEMIDGIPMDLQREISAMRELDTSYQAILAQMDTLRRELESLDHSQDVAVTRRLLQQLQEKLIESQELADMKLEAVQHMMDIVEQRQIKLDTGKRSLDITVEAGAPSLPPQKEVPERPNKRPRRTPRMESLAGNCSPASSSGSGSSSVPLNPSATTPTAAGTAASNNSAPDNNNTITNTTKSTAKTHSHKKAATVRKKKKKSRIDREGSPPDVPIDPDEPTYCVCEQVSYGEMIGCDNDLCYIEWFHFSCVGLTHKPKGRWFCPKCRGDKPTSMKPRAQFLRELEKYNREQGEKS